MYLLQPLLPRIVNCGFLRSMERDEQSIVVGALPWWLLGCTRWRGWRVPGEFEISDRE